MGALAADAGHVEARLRGGRRRVGRRARQLGRLLPVQQRRRAGRGVSLGDGGEPGHRHHRRPSPKVMREHNPDVKVIPNFIPAWVCDLPREPGLRVGWMGGASHGGDAWASSRQPVRRFLLASSRPGRGATWWEWTTGPPSGTDRVAFRRRGQHVVPEPEAFYRSVDFDILPASRAAVPDPVLPQQVAHQGAGVRGQGHPRHRHRL